MTKSSLEKLKTCDPRLQALMMRVDKIRPIQVIEGHRGEEAQNEAYAKGNSKVKWPNGEHNKNPSNAVDVAPRPLDWGNKQAFIDLSVVVKEEAQKLGLKIIWGGDFKSFFDGPHYELGK